MKTKLRLKAVALREKGYSINELKGILNVSKSTISLWVRNVELSKVAKEKLESKYTKAQLLSQKAIQEKTKNKNEVANLFARGVLQKSKVTQEIKILICAMIWWCEGNKGTRNAVVFTNSDSDLVKSFLSFFRDSFQLDETKFRVLMHLHSYHNENNQKKFWSKVTNIPQLQFNRSYLKSSNGKYKKENYQGCIKVAYNDVSIARKLQSVAKLLMERYK